MGAAQVWHFSNDEMNSSFLPNRATLVPRQRLLELRSASDRIRAFSARLRERDSFPGQEVQIFVRDIFRWIPNELIGDQWGHLSSKGNLYLAGALELLLDLGKFEMEMVFIKVVQFFFSFQIGRNCLGL